MKTMVSSLAQLGSEMIFAIGVFGGLAIGISAHLQGKAAASACDALGKPARDLPSMSLFWYY